MKKHYHVLTGLNGCYMPDNNEVYRTLFDAQEGMRYHRDLIKNGEMDVQFVGSVREGDLFWRYKPKSKREYSAGYPYRIELRECTEDCDLEG